MQERISAAKYRELTNKKVKKRKYMNIRTEYNGRWYDSKGEARYAMYLDKLKTKGEIISWIPQHKFPISTNSKIHAVVDFLVNRKIFILENQSDQWEAVACEFIDYKGWDKKKQCYIETRVSKNKRIQVEENYNLKIRLVNEKDIS